MITLLVLSALFVVTLSAPQAQVTPILSHTAIRDDAGQYSFQYQTGNGITMNEQGILKKLADGSDYVLVKRGSYDYTSPEGVPVRISYIADDNGFVPQGDQIPVTQQ